MKTKKLPFLKYMVWDPYHFNMDLDRRIPFSIQPILIVFRVTPFDQEFTDFYLNMEKLKLFFEPQLIFGKLQITVNGNVAIKLNLI